MAKITKNRSDSEMFINYKEELTFEHTDRDGAASPQPASTKKPEPEKESKYLTSELSEQIDKLLLELKVKLYKEGIVDYKLKASLEKGQIAIVPVPFIPKAPKTASEDSSTSDVRRTPKKR
ncbi:MAG TPA: hypothetical protein VN611_16235 [Patescibacteria group bacterium]|nr:hypothetical protein [Patescibacteria group bacterium]